MIKIVLIALAFVTSITFAEARPGHHRGVHRHAEARAASTHRLRVHSVRDGHAHHARHSRGARSPVADDQPSWFSGLFVAQASGGSALVSKARSYLGQGARQVGVRTTLWCSAFIRKLSPTTGVDDRAASWLNRPRVAAAVGAVVVTGRHHVGIVSGFTKAGDPIVISGNHGRRVAESVYPRKRVLAYVSAN
jgi:hypothetical protein